MIQKISAMLFQLCLASPPGQVYPASLRMMPTSSIEIHEPPFYKNGSQNAVISIITQPEIIMMWSSCKY
jgi:hypothetical protein